MLIEVGNTKVICANTIEEFRHFKGSGQGWITAEYSLLPRSTQTRRISARKSFRADTWNSTNWTSFAERYWFKSFGWKNILIDCDVIQADGGTRTASITGAFVALVEEIHAGVYNKDKPFPIKDFIAAISVGILSDNNAVLDLCYEEDSKATVDMNVVMTGNWWIYWNSREQVRERPYTRTELNMMLEKAEKINELIDYQKEVLGDLAWKVGSEPWKKWLLLLK